MRLAYSNIAWPAEHDAGVADVLLECGFAGVEVAPTRIWNPLSGVTDRQLGEHRAFWESRGLPIVAAQALLFGQNELKLFATPESRRQTLDYLAHVIGICARLGARVQVFGSPRNRRIESLPREQAVALAVDFFGALADIAERAGTAIGLEPNPPAYGADFLVDAAEALDLVRRVDRPGLRLHLDTGCAALLDDDLPAAISAGRTYLAHFHASSPMLQPLVEDDGHAAAAAALRRTGYGGWVSVEMRAPTPFDPAEIRRCATVARRYYG